MPSSQGGDGVDKVVPICALLASLERRDIKGPIRTDEGTVDMPRGTAGSFNQHHLSETMRPPVNFVA
jgi:hypothetical protein